MQQDVVLPHQRIVVKQYNAVKGLDTVFALGDIACMVSEQNPKGHPQVAPVAIQQAQLLAGNLKRLITQQSLLPFAYRNKGSMATVGRNLAVAELSNIKINGFVAWMAWMLVHLMSVIGVKNRLFILINWIWQYITYDQSLRLIIKATEKRKPVICPETRKQITLSAKHFTVTSNYQEILRQVQ